MPKYLKALCRVDSSFIGLDTYIIWAVLFKKKKAQSYKYKIRSENKYLFVMRKGNHNKMQRLKTENIINIRSLEK